MRLLLVEDDPMIGEGKPATFRQRPDNQEEDMHVDQRSGRHHTE